MMNAAINTRFKEKLNNDMSISPYRGQRKNRNLGTADDAQFIFPTAYPEARSHNMT